MIDLFSVRKPPPTVLDRFVEDMSRKEICGSRSDPDRRYNEDGRRVLLGKGEGVWKWAQAAIQGWKMFNVHNSGLHRTDTPIEPGKTVALITYFGGLWLKMACRIETVIHASGDIERYGFQYATLPVHIARGEESFIVEWRHRDDTVWFEIKARSRLRFWWSYPAYPLIRYLQAKFRRQSCQAMKDSIER